MKTGPALLPELTMGELLHFYDYLINFYFTGWQWEIFSKSRIMKIMGLYVNWSLICLFIWQNVMIILLRWEWVLIERKEDEASLNPDPWLSLRRECIPHCMFIASTLSFIMEVRIQYSLWWRHSTYRWNSKCCCNLVIRGTVDFGDGLCAAIKACWMKYELVQVHLLCRTLTNKCLLLL